MKNRIRISLLALLPLLLFFGCTDKNAYKKVDVSKINVDLPLQHFEHDFFDFNAENFEAHDAMMQQKYGSFFNYYTQQIMFFGMPKFNGDTAKYDRKSDILGFVNDTIMRSVYVATDKLYGQSVNEEEMEMAVKHLKYYFPKIKMSRIITFLSGFQYGASTFDDSVLVVGLDMYLGADCPFYTNLDIPMYIVRKLKREFIVPNAMQSVYQLYFEKPTYSAELPLIEAMVNEGKKYYFMECMMPQLPDSMIIGYTAAQTVWCTKSEKQIWQYFNDQDLLYKTNFVEQKRYTTEGPTTTGMPNDSPGKVGAWVGWQIVRKYMKEAAGKVTLEDLLLHTDAKLILKQAKYKP